MPVNQGSAIGLTVDAPDYGSQIASYLTRRAEIAQQEAHEDKVREEDRKNDAYAAYMKAVKPDFDGIDPLLKDKAQQAYVDFTHKTVNSFLHNTPGEFQGDAAEAAGEYSVMIDKLKDSSKGYATIRAGQNLNPELQQVANVLNTTQSKDYQRAFMDIRANGVDQTKLNNPDYKQAYSDILTTEPSNTTGRFKLGAFTYKDGIAGATATPNVDWGASAQAAAKELKPFTTAPVYGPDENKKPIIIKYRTSVVGTHDEAMSLTYNQDGTVKPEYASMVQAGQPVPNIDDAYQEDMKAKYGSEEKAVAAWKFSSTGYNGDNWDDKGNFDVGTSDAPGKAMTNFRNLYKGVMRQSAPVVETPVVKPATTRNTIYNEAQKDKQELASPQESSTTIKTEDGKTFNTPLHNYVNLNPTKAIIPQTIAIDAQTGKETIVDSKNTSGEVTAKAVIGLYYPEGSKTLEVIPDGYTGEYIAAPVREYSTTTTETTDAGTAIRAKKDDDGRYGGATDTTAGATPKGQSSHTGESTKQNQVSGKYYVPLELTLGGTNETEDERKKSDAYHNANYFQYANQHNAEIKDPALIEAAKKFNKTNIPTPKVVTYTVYDKTGKAIGTVSSETKKKKYEQAGYTVK